MSTDTESNYELMYSERYIALKRLHNAFLGEKNSIPTWHLNLKPYTQC
jgi:hypothetical protein